MHQQGVWVAVCGPGESSPVIWGNDGWRVRVISFESLGTGCERETRKYLSAFSSFWSVFLVLIINNSAAIKLIL
jgi:hypothetical protein